MEYSDFLRMVNLRMGGRQEVVPVLHCRNRDGVSRIGGPTENLNEMKYNESNL